MDSFLSWIGGKKLLRDTIIQKFPKDNSYSRYVEVFGGAGWVLFAKDKHAIHEVYNDINSNLVNLFKCVKYHAEELQKELNFMINYRDLFNEYLTQINSKGLTDIQRSARYFFLVKLSYGATIDTYGAVKKDVEKNIQLAELLKDIDGKFVLSYNDDEFVRKLYKDFNMIEIERNHNLTSRYNKNRRYKELIIKNY